MASKAQLESAQKKRKPSLKVVKPKRNTTKRASTSSRVKKNSSRTLSASTSKEKKAKSGSPPWSPARWHSFVVSVLRSGTRRYPPKYECLNDAKTEKKINAKTGRLAQHFRCAGCSDEFPATGVQVDHITPVVGPSGFTTWDDYIANMFCEKDNFQILCLACHAVKTKQEKGERHKTKS